MIFYTSDHHFNHKKIIEYCNRPFKSIDEMNDEMIHRWNEVVAPADVVYHLGDFAFAVLPIMAKFAAQLNGTKVLIKGNHDKSSVTMHAAGFEEVFTDLMVGNQYLYLHHAPVAETMGWHGAKYHLCGHVHEKWRRRGNIINVGVDVWDFYPKTLEQLLQAKEG